MKLNAETIFNRAQEFLIEGKNLEGAEHLLNDLLNNDPESEVLLFMIAVSFMKRKYHQLAIRLYKIVLEKNPQSAAAWNNLGFVYKEILDIEKAKEVFDRAIQLNPTEADYYTNLGTMYVAQGTPKVAIAHFDKALELKPDHQHAHWNKSLALLESGDYENGFKEYEWGVRTVDREQRHYHQNGTPEWDGTPGKTVVVYGEQGIGDELMFASILPDIMKDCNIILDAHPRLANIFRQSFPNIPVYGTRKEAVMSWTRNHEKIDAKIPMGSLGKFYRKKLEDFPNTPYLQANQAIKEQFKKSLESLGDRPKIGISWRGGIKQTNKNERYLPLELWLPLFDLDADFISLQYNDDAHEDVNEFCAKHNKVLHHWPEVLADYDQTAGLVSNLDLIISVPQSVVHLAGGLGITTWQLCPKKALWQMGPYGQNMPWYGSVSNFWQDNREIWEPVIDNVKGELCNLFQKSIAA